MDKKKETELLSILKSLNNIYERKRSEDEYINPLEIIIKEYRLKFVFVYGAVSIISSYNHNFNVFFISFDEGDDKTIEEMFSIIDLPPDLIVKKLSQIGIREIWWKGYKKSSIRVWIEVKFILQ